MSSLLIWTKRWYNAYKGQLFTTGARCFGWRGMRCGTLPAGLSPCFPAGRRKGIPPLPNGRCRFFFFSSRFSRRCIIVVAMVVLACFGGSTPACICYFYSVAAALGGPDKAPEVCLFYVSFFIQLLGFSPSRINTRLEPCQE